MTVTVPAYAQKCSTCGIPESYVAAVHYKLTVTRESAVYFNSIRICRDCVLHLLEKLNEARPKDHLIP